LRERRHGGDQDLLRQTLEFLGPIRDWVLANASISPGVHVLDVGCGDGLIAFAALVRVGNSGRVTYSDVSSELLGQRRYLAREADALERCRFVKVSASTLAPIEGTSVDAVTLRSVLSYARDKVRALREPPDRLFGYDVAPVSELGSKVKPVAERNQPSHEDPLIDFDEHDLVAFARMAGFEEIHPGALVDVEPYRTSPLQISWEARLHSSPNTLAPTLAEPITEVSSPDESERLRAYLLPLVEPGEGECRRAVAYLWAAR
jgi:arsenite methyltransferase